MGKFIPHKIPAESVEEGDVIAVSWRVGAIEHTRTAPVSRIIFNHGKRSRSFIAPGGDEIVLWTPESRVTFRIIERHKVAEPMLAGMDAL